MTCEHCCGADQLFDAKSAQKELKTYRRKGPKKSTRRLLRFLEGYELADRSLLDIGGGIGSIQWYFHEQGGSRTLDVDASSGYISVARDYASEMHYDEAGFIIGDYNDVHDELDAFDYVALDKVVCCYPDFRKLLGNALGKTKRTLILSMPIGGIISSALSKVAEWYMRYKKNPFRSYVHDPSEVHLFIESHGFKLVNKGTSFPWLLRAYERV